MERLHDLDAVGRRPGCIAPVSRTLSSVRDRSDVLPPGRYALDDEEVLARANVTELARLARERAEARRRAKPALELAFLLCELADLCTARAELVPRCEVRAQRVVVEVPDDHDGRHRGPAARERRDRWTAGALPGHGPLISRGPCAAPARPRRRRSRPSAKADRRRGVGGTG